MHFKTPKGEGPGHVSQVFERLNLKSSFKFIIKLDSSKTERLNHVILLY